MFHYNAHRLMDQSQGFAVPAVAILLNLFVIYFVHLGAHFKIIIIF